LVANYRLFDASSSAQRRPSRFENERVLQRERDVHALAGAQADQAGMRRDAAIVVG